MKINEKKKYCCIENSFFLTRTNDFVYLNNY